MSVIKLGFILLISSSSIQKSTSQSQVSRPKVPTEEDVDQGRIVSGTVAAPSEFPFVAKIMIYFEVNGVGKTVHTCGGALLTPTIVVTAAHCFHAEYQKTNSYLVQVGVLGLNRPQPPQPPPPAPTVPPVKFTDFDILKWKLHPKYNGQNLRYDIAVFELNMDAVTKSIVVPVQTIPLPTNGDYPVGRTDCTVMGWGYTDPIITNISTTSKWLMKAMAKIISIDDCKKNTHASHIYDGALCSANPPEAFCGGDSGGPLICPDPNNGNAPFLMGTVSSNKDPCGGPDNPDIYMHLGYKENLDFIKKYIDPKNKDWGPAVTVVEDTSDAKRPVSSRVTFLVCTLLIYIISSGVCKSY